MSSFVWLWRIWGKPTDLLVLLIFIRTFQAFWSAFFGVDKKNEGDEPQEVVFIWVEVVLHYLVLSIHVHTLQCTMIWLVTTVYEHMLCFTFIASHDWLITSTNSPTDPSCATQQCISFFMQLWSRQKNWLLPALESLVIVSSQRACSCPELFGWWFRLLFVVDMSY